MGHRKIETCVTEEQYTAVAVAAAAKGLSVASFVRMVALEGARYPIDSAVGIFLPPTINDRSD